MKQKFSLLSLVSSHTLKPVISICIIMASFQAGLLYYFGVKQEELMNFNGSIQPFYAWGEHFWMELSYLIALCGILVLCLLENSLRNGKYTLLRLSTKETDFFLACFFNTLCCLLLLWAVEAIVLICGSYYYISVTPSDFLTNQSIFLATLYSNFLQGIFPTVNLAVWVKSMLQILLISSTVASVSTSILQGKLRKYLIGFLVFLVLNYFSSRYVESNLVFSVIYAVLLVFVLKGGLSCEREKETM
ncbi:MAG: hypothetical protein R3Y63_03505 [Eubacteriales bacterium]